MLVALILGVATSGADDDTRAAAAAAPAPSSGPVPAHPIPSMGEHWFALGASLPWYQRGCDFGCGQGRGLRGTRDRVDRLLRDMSRRGVRVVRWELFPSQAWQVRRDESGMPRSLAASVAPDFDVATELAAKHDVFLLPVVFPDPAQLPTTWFTDPAQSAALATTLRPLFARSRTETHVLGWELVSGAEQLEDQGIATREQLRNHAADLIRALDRVAPKRLSFIGPSSVSRIDGWTGLGADVFDPQDDSSTTGDACASCRNAKSVAAEEGADAPIMIGAFDVANQQDGAERLAAYVRHGYGGALAWSWRSVRPASHPDRPTHMPDTATWALHYAQRVTGPRSRPLNPCFGPDARAYLCPNLKMARPSDIRIGRSARRTILYSTNSLDSRGRGPASLTGRRDGRFTMRAQQLLHRAGGGAPLRIDTKAKLLFKAIPGQYRYWKWNGAAQMQLWRLDSTGQPVQLARVGPKTVYCLRDLKRTAPGLARAPRNRVFPACSQRLSERSATLGTSVGWSDIYPYTYFENWIDVTGLRGCFAYVHIADPTNVIYESNEDDNASSVVVRLPFRGTNRGCPGARPLPTTGAHGIY